MVVTFKETSLVLDVFELIITKNHSSLVNAREARVRQPRVPRALQDWIDFSPSLAAAMLLPYQLLLLVAKVAMIRAASSNSSVNGVISRGQMLYGATTEQLRPTMKGTVST